MCPCGLFLPDVNECTDDTHMCDDVAMCSDTVGSYTCTCITGYTGTGFTCNGSHTGSNNTHFWYFRMFTDVNECGSGTAICSENADCTNTDGSYTCLCLPGLTGDGEVCVGTYVSVPNMWKYYVKTYCFVDVDECLDSKVCHSDATCNNVYRGYTCQCNAGYSGDGINCLGKLTHYKTCLPLLATLIHIHCADIDECMGENPCHPNAECNNTAGSYTCQCASGFFGDGTTCEGMVHCMAEHHAMWAFSATCSCWRGIRRIPEPI